MKSSFFFRHPEKEKDSYKMRQMDYLNWNMDYECGESCG